PPFVSTIIAKNAPQIRLGTDAFLYEIKEQVNDTNRWGEVISQFKMSSSARFASVSRMERDFYTPLRAVAQGLEDFGGEDLVGYTASFEGAMADLNEVAGRAAGGPVSPADKAKAASTWEYGRVVLNKYLSTLNTLTGTKGPKFESIPKDTEGGSEERRERFLNFKKELAKCQQGGLGVNVCADIMQQYANQNL
ncbi:unnamed protein product, partial [Discosporangium mesarthrocarpum]